jgi:hypothetical protein
MRGVRDRVLVRTRAEPLSASMADRKKSGPRLCAKCRLVIAAGEGHMRAPDLRVYHVACYDGRDARARYRPRR